MKTTRKTIRTINEKNYKKHNKKHNRKTHSENNYWIWTRPTYGEQLYIFQIYDRQNMNVLQTVNKKNNKKTS